MNEGIPNLDQIKFRVHGLEKIYISYQMEGIVFASLLNYPIEEDKPQKEE